MKGKIITTSVSLAKKIECDEIWQITRGTKVNDSFKWVPELSPSPNLFSTYLKKWKGNPPEEWWPLYVEVFKNELNTDEKLTYLRLLWRSIQKGKVIVLACFCKDFQYCHRSLVGDFLKNYDIEVIEYSTTSEHAAAKDENYIQIDQLTLQL